MVVVQLFKVCEAFSTSCFRSFQVPTHSVKLSDTAGWESTVFGQKDSTWLVWQPGSFLISVRRHEKHLGWGLKLNSFSQIGPFLSETLTAASQFSNICAWGGGIKYRYYRSDFVIRFSIISLTVSPNESSNFLAPFLSVSSNIAETDSFKSFLSFLTLPQLCQIMYKLRYHGFPHAIHIFEWLCPSM